MVSVAQRPCVLALDLGTTAFKAAPALPDGVPGSVTVVPYQVQYGARGQVTCDPMLYIRAARRALRGAARTAHTLGLRPVAVGLSSQAQTFVPVDADNRPVGHAVVWTDAAAWREAAKVEEALPDFPAVCGFLRPLPLLFLPKVCHSRRRLPHARRFLLLNEWIAFWLTGAAFGDNVNQGMGGFYDIRRRSWNAESLRVAGIGEEALAATAPAGELAYPVRDAIARDLGLPEAVPVYACGNDQSCAAVGAGVSRAGEVFANFGTAMVVYALRDAPAKPTSPDQIAGISPLPDLWFLLGVESEFGNVLEWLAGLLWRRQGVSGMLKATLERAGSIGRVPSVRPRGGGRVRMGELTVGSSREEIALGFVQYYAERFCALLRDVTGSSPPSRILAGGGVSRSHEWLTRLSDQVGVELEPTLNEHPALTGIARIIAGKTSLLR